MTETWFSQLFGVAGDAFWVFHGPTRSHALTEQYNLDAELQAKKRRLHNYDAKRSNAESSALRMSSTAPEEVDFDSELYCAASAGKI